ncbi:hypothetical protein L248_2845 [Schleiferilactobacillus shenzhenensis LY-73]|uniref:Uncharacterized protein n=1 Tax=Schleiferilactobacillus shenzhenensis LY-73 TaxID=1231336 RepID=U4TNZ7_9LACO|nr:hypothetical protein L248_2845 [Schleiferilactobacillus shenzhenensis LY-73]
MIENNKNQDKAIQLPDGFALVCFDDSLFFFPLCSMILQ